MRSPNGIACVRWPAPPLSAGASGIAIAVHTHPDTAYTDPMQTVDIPTFEGIQRDRAKISEFEAI